MPIPSVEHLQSLLVLIQALASEGIEMESHQYDGAAFGGFALVLAKGHAKARFVWNAKELILRVEYQKVQNKAGDGTWEHDAYISIASSTEVFSEIGSNAEAMLL